MIPEWLFNYRTEQTQPTQSLDSIAGKCLCDCCFFPTLNGHGGYEICPICWWEDDPTAADDLNGDSVVNSGLSLNEARRNFQEHQHCYFPWNAIEIVQRPNDTRATFLVFLRQILNCDIAFEPTEFESALEKLKGGI